MPSFEQAFSDTQAAAETTRKAATQVASVAGLLRKAAQEGNVSSLKRASDRLKESLSALRQEVDNASSSWAFNDEDASTYMAEKYSDELRIEAREAGLDIFERDGVLISYPSTIRILPNEIAVRIDRKKVSAVRPSKLTSMLLSNQQKKPRFRPQSFLEALHNAYKIINGSLDSGAMFKDRDNTPVVPLDKIYGVFTSLPGSNRDYDRMDFARDIYFLDVGETRTTRSGAQVSFPISTAAGLGKGIFSFVGPDGNVINYHGVQFSGGD